LNMATVTIENVVAKTSYGSGLDIPKIAAKVEGADYNPDSFPGFIWNPEQSRIAVLVLSNGRAISTGATSVADAEESLNDLHKQLLGRELSSRDDIEIKVENIVASIDLDTFINLRAARISLGDMDVRYSPDEFPGLITKSGRPPQDILLFESGKMVSTGGKTVEAISEVFIEIESSLRASGAIV